MKKILLLLILFSFLRLDAVAAFQDEVALFQPYIVQAEDTLPHLADKYYQDSLRWPAIWLATQRLAASDLAIPAIENPRVLQPGQLLVIPPPEQIEALLTEYLADGYSPPGSAPLSPLTSQWLADFSLYVEEARRHFRIPGVAVAVVRNNQIVLAQGLGVRELGRSEPVTPETVFGIGSTSKAMNAMLMAVLVDQGVISWDQPVVDVWPGFDLSDPAVTPDITFRHMFAMNSGVPRADLVWSGAGLSAEQVMESLAALPVEAAPGSRFQYNNQIVAAGGYIAALAANGQYGTLQTHYADLLRSHVFEPIGMSGATMSVEAAQFEPNHATPHDFSLDGAILPTYYHSDPGIGPAGEVYANLLDMARFLLTEINRGNAPDGQRVVSAQSLTETWRPQIHAYQDASYALGWFVEQYQGVEMVWHDGDVLGFKSLLVFVPEADAGLVLLTNRTISYGFANSVRYRFIEALYDLDVEAGAFYKTQWTDFEKRLPEIREPLRAVLSPEEAAAYVGRYSDGWQVEQRADGTLWVVRGQYYWQLLAETPNTFMVNNGFAITTLITFSKPEDNGQPVMSFELATGEAGAYVRLEP